jgi:hypothetical protein
VVDQPPRRSRRIQGLPPKQVEVNPPLPPLRHRLDQTDTFVPTGPVETIDTEPTETNASAPEVVSISDLEVEDFTHPFNPPLTGTDSPVVSQILAPQSDFTNNHPLQWVIMEGTSEVSGSGVPTTPTSTIITRGILSSWCL